MKPWDDLTLEQYAVVINATDEAYLNDVLDEYSARLQWAMTGDVRRSSVLDDAAKRALMPRFADVVTDLIDRGWIRLYRQVWSDVIPLTPAEVQEAVREPNCWIKTSGDTDQMIMLRETDEWRQLVRSGA